MSDLLNSKEVQSFLTEYTEAVRALRVAVQEANQAKRKYSKVKSKQYHLPEPADHTYKEFDELQDELYDKMRAIVSQSGLYEEMDELGWSSSSLDC